MFDGLIGIFKDLIYFYLNYILNVVPSRKFRSINYYLISKGKISLHSTIGMGVKILDIRNVTIKDRVNINYGCILDGRGAKLNIHSDVDISPRVMIWTLEHDPKSDTFQSRSGPVTIEHHSWLASGAIILPNTTIGYGTVISAGTVVKGFVEDRVLLNAHSKRTRNCDCTYKLKGLRRFR